MKRRDASANTTYYRYDGLNRRTKVAYPDTTYSYFRYDAVSNLTGALDAWGWTYFSYDALNRLTQELRLRGNNVLHSYDAVGNRLKLSIGGGEPAQYFRYDALSRMTAAASVAVGTGGYGQQAYGTTSYGDAANIPGTGAAYYAYDAASRRTKTFLGNGVATYFSYDAANRLLSLKSILSGGQALTYFNYAYDAANRITKIAREGGKTIYYSYDGADRLTGENWYNAGMQNVYAFAWSYDAVGNRHWQNRLGQQSYFTYDAANALRKSFPAGGSATYYSYDPNGNCTKVLAPSVSATYFAYNSVNLMTRATFRNGTTNYFSYDALNRRRALKDSNGLAYFMYDQDPSTALGAGGLCQLVERNNTGNVRAEYTRGASPIPGIGDVVAAKINTSTTSYYQYPSYDHRGNVHRIINASGAVTGSFEYNAWGEKLLNQPPPEGTRFSFSAPAWITLNDDPDGWIIATPTRHYSAGTGRFLQKDPLGYFVRLNLYLADFVPRQVDPMGTAKCCYSDCASFYACNFTYKQMDSSDCEMQGYCCRQQALANLSPEFAKFGVAEGLEIIGCFAGAPAAGPFWAEALILCLIATGAAEVILYGGSLLGRALAARQACDTAEARCQDMVQRIHQRVWPTPGPGPGSLP